jgi:hypothetical protein
VLPESSDGFFYFVYRRLAMKKKVKKLELNKETVRNLTTDDLKKIAGGTVETKPVTICNSCRPTICP